MGGKRRLQAGTPTGAPSAAVWAAGMFQAVLGAVASAYLVTESAPITLLAVVAALVIALAVLWSTQRGRLSTSRKNLVPEPHEAPVHETSDPEAQDGRPAGSGLRTSVRGE